MACGRELNIPVWYGVLPADGGVLPDSAELVRLDRRQRGTSILIRAPHFTESGFFGAYRDWKSTDDGRTWDWVVYPIDSPSNLGTAAADVVDSPSNLNVIYRYLGDIGLYLRSEDHGTTWQLPQYRVEGEIKERLAARLSRKSFYRVDFRLVALHPQRPLTLYAGIRVVPWSNPIPAAPGFESYDLPGVYISKDGGENWTPFSGALRSFSALRFDVRPLGISPANPNVMFGQSSQGLAKSTDGGGHWQPVGEQELLNSRARSLEEKTTGVKIEGPRLGFGIEATEFLMDPFDQDVVFVVSNKGVYRTLDGGQHWRLLGLGFDMVDGYNNAALNPADPKELFVGTQYGLFRSKDRGCHFEKIYPPAERKTKAVPTPEAQQR